jgi:hypothetical protein
MPPVLFFAPSHVVVHELAVVDDIPGMVKKRIVLIPEGPFDELSG